MNIIGKTILISGGTSGIGLEIVRKLALHNRIIVISKKGKLPTELLDPEYGIQQHHLDLAHKPSLEAAVELIQREHTSLDMLINNAAVQNTPELLSDDFNYDAIQSEIDTNFTAVCHLTYLCLPLLQAADAAHIININSGLAIAPKRESAIYCATKSAMDSFSTSLSHQFRSSSIYVQQAFLPLVATAMTEGRGKNKLRADLVAEAIISKIGNGREINDIGKVKLLRLINSLCRPLAKRIMREA